MSECLSFSQLTLMFDARSHRSLSVDHWSNPCCWCVWLCTCGGNVEAPVHSNSQRIFFFFLCSRWHSSDADSNSHLPSNSLISSAFNQGIWCALVALLVWLISIYCVWMFALIIFQTVYSVLSRQRALISIFLPLFVSMLGMHLHDPQKDMHREEDMHQCCNFMVIFVYVRAERACVSVWLLLGPMCGATLQSSVLAQTRPQLRYGNRRHNLYVALI